MQRFSPSTNSSTTNMWFVADIASARPSNQNPLENCAEYVDPDGRRDILSSPADGLVAVGELPLSNESSVDGSHPVQLVPKS